MTNQNYTPNGPGWYYRVGGSIVDVDTDGDGLYYWITGFPNSVPVTDDGAWLGPVPMPGEWAPRELFDQLWYAAAELSPDPNSRSRIALLKAAIKWTNENPAPEVTP